MTQLHITTWMLFLVTIFTIGICQGFTRPADLDQPKQLQSLDWNKNFGVTDINSIKPTTIEPEKIINEEESNKLSTVKNSFNFNLIRVKRRGGKSSGSGSRSSHGSRSSSRSHGSHGSRSRAHHISRGRVASSSRTRSFHRPSWSSPHRTPTSPFRNGFNSNRGYRSNYNYRSVNTYNTPRYNNNEYNRPDWFGNNFNYNRGRRCDRQIFGFRYPTTCRTSFFG